MRAEAREQPNFANESVISCAPALEATLLTVAFCIVYFTFVAGWLHPHTLTLPSHRISNWSSFKWQFLWCRYTWKTSTTCWPRVRPAKKYCRFEKIPILEYLSQDWQWCRSRATKRLAHWYKMQLSSEIRATLFKYTLSQIHSIAPLDFILLAGRMGPDPDPA